VQISDAANLSATFKEQAQRFGIADALVKITEMKTGQDLNGFELLTSEQPLGNLALDERADDPKLRTSRCHRTVDDFIPSCIDQIKSHFRLSSSGSWAGDCQQDVTQFRTLQFGDR
jgi:hypothetical protein